MRSHILTRYQKHKKLTQTQKHTLNGSMNALIEVFQVAEEEDVLEKGLIALFQRLRDIVTTPLCDWITVEDALEDLLDGKLSQETAAYKIAMETTGLAVLQHR
jgi:hypothetical protein